MKIKSATKKDIDELRKLILMCIKKEFANYQDEKIKAMKEYSSKKRLENYLKTWKVFTLVEKKKIIGTISVEDNRTVFSLYGITEDARRRLIDFAGKRCAKNKTENIAAIAMPENKKDFSARGFRVSKKIILSFGKIKFNELKMEKKLK